MMMTCDYAVKADKGFKSVQERDLTRELPVIIRGNEQDSLLKIAGPTVVLHILVCAAPDMPAS